MVAEKLVIKKAGVGDADLLTKLSETTFRDKFGPLNKPEDMEMYISAEMNVDKLTAELNDPKNLFFLAYYSDLAIGYVKLRTGSRPPELSGENPLEIERLYILQGYQNMKAGATLMEHCINYASGNRHDVIWLGVWEHNEGAIKFYRNFGFELFGSHPFVLGTDEQTDVMMKKELAYSRHN